MDLENYFKNGKVYVWKETFAIIKSKKPYPNAFANIIDKNETTVIIEQSKYNDEDVIEIEKDWRGLMGSGFTTSHFFFYFRFIFCEVVKPDTDLPFISFIN